MKKMIEFSKKFLLKLPIIIQAPMAGGITTPKFVAEVSNNGGLGSFATGYLSTEQVKKGIQDIKKLTSKPFSVNLFIPNELNQTDTLQIKKYQNHLNKYRLLLGMQETKDIPTMPKDNFNEIVDLLLEEKIELISFTFGNLSKDIINTFKKENTYLIGTATSLEEAKILEQSGIDAIVVQGYEAGGHRGGFITPPEKAAVGTMALIPQIAKYIDRPIIAAGGIMDGNGIAAALALGATGVQLGTAFLTTQESGANEVYKNELLKQYNADPTVITNVISGKPARGINTQYIQEVEKEGLLPLEYPISHYLTSSLRKEAVNKNNPDMMAMWSGQGVPLITKNLTVKALLTKLRTETKEALKKLSMIERLIEDRMREI